MKNFILNFRQFKTLTFGVACISGLMGTLPVAPALATPAMAIMGVNAAPVIDNFTPTAAIGSNIVIEGSGFTGTTEVRFGSLSVTSFASVTDNQIIVAVPAAATIGNLTVVVGSQSVSTTTAFTPYVTWSGGVDKNWNNPFNWGNNQVPTATTNVIINAGTSNLPTINTNAFCNNLTIQSGVTLTMNTGANLTVSGLLVNSGTYTQNDGSLTITNVFSNQGGFSHTGGTINFAAASGDQYLPALTYYNLTISGNGDKYLQGNTTVTNSLNFTGSNLKTVNANDVLTLNGTISGEDNNHSFIGKLMKKQTISGVITNTFGNIGIGFTNAGGGNWGEVTATRITGKAISSPYNAAKQSINRYWIIAPANPNTNTAVNLTLTWLASENNGMSFPANQAQAWRKEATDKDWIPVDNMKNITFNGNERSISVTTNTFSTWAITDQPTTLPVSLLYFNGKATSKGSELNWSTASEKNADAFVVEKSTNGKNFEAIGRLKAMGTTNLQQLYSFTDGNATAQTNYYRLRQVDTDGTAAYSSIITVTANHKGTEFNAVAYPNPFSESLNLKLNTPVAKAEVIIKTIDGREVYRQNINEAAPLNTLTLSKLPKLQAGFYVVTLVANNQITTLKVAQQ